MLACLLTDVPGCSQAFDAGFVAYSNEAKHRRLGIALDRLPGGGAVSQDVVLAMASGALARARADIVRAVTGWAEDMGGPEKPGGRVHFACARRDGSTRHRKSELGTLGRQACEVVATVALGRQRRVHLARLQAHHIETGFRQTLG